VVDDLRVVEEESMEKEQEAIGAPPLSTTAGQCWTTTAWNHLNELY
jgi:hypothetical protein